VVFGSGLVVLRARADNTKADHWLLIAVWTLPGTMMIAAAGWIPLAPIVLIAFAGRLVWRLAQIDSREVRPLPDQAAAAVA
jgi:FtsH-binding integral membrane protein